jgi:ATP-dependent DNA ligase
VTGHAKSFLSQSNDPPFEYFKGNTDILKQTYIKDIGQLEVKTLMNKAVELGYEGICLRDTRKIYDFKRSNYLLKAKPIQFDTQRDETDCTVTSIEVEPFPVIKEGKITHENLLVTMIVKQPNKIECRCGSGFSVDFRRKVTEDPSLVVGKVCEFYHQGYGGKGRMRFPIFNRIREDL